MKISKTPTPWVLIKAQVSSEWDDCNCALLDINDLSMENLKRWDKVATTAKEELKKDGYAHLAMYDHVEFLNILNIDEDWHKEENIAEQIEEQGWCYVEMEDGDDVDDMGHPEQRTDCHQIKLYGEGAVCWIAYSKHTAEEFWTKTININEL